MTFGDAVVQICKHVINNMTEIMVNHVRSQPKHDLRLDNGAGAWILLTGDQVLINGLTAGSSGNVFDIIYIGQDKLAWFTRDSDTGNLVIHIPANTQLQFERGT